MFKKRSFFQKLTGGLSLRDLEDEVSDDKGDLPRALAEEDVETEVSEWRDTEDEMTSELSVDVYQTPDEVVVKAFAAGVRPEDLDIDIARDMVVIAGSLKEGALAEQGDYIHRELYWGSFVRTIMLPEEIDPETAIATEKNGLVILRLPKIDKKRRTKVRVKSR